MKKLKRSKFVISLLLIIAIAAGFVPSVLAQPVRNDIDSLSYSFIAANVGSAAELTFTIQGLGGYPAQTAAANVTANGEVVFSFSGLGWSSMGNPGFVERIDASPIVLDLQSITVNGGYVLIPVEPLVLEVGGQWTNGLPNEWSGVTAGTVLAANDDAYLQFGAGWEFFAGGSQEPSVPVTTPPAITEPVAPVQPIMQTNRSIEYAVAMGNGWNLGNTFDSINFDADGGSIETWETDWGNPVVTRELINSIKSRGFDHIRIPLTIDNRGIDLGIDTPDDEIRFIIDEQWLARYREVVQWALEADLYVMLNIHHDSWFWLGRNHGGNPMGAGWDGDVDSPHYRRFCDYWIQLAQYFADMPDEVMFETVNEPEFNVPEAHGTTAAENLRRLDVINQAAFDIIRATPGNETRMIVIPTYKTNHDPRNSAPARDFIALLQDENIIATVHYYSEWVFSNHLGRTMFDEPLFNQYDPNNNFTARAAADEFFQIINTHFVSRGIGVSIGEWGLLGYDSDTDYFGVNVLQRGEELKYYEYIQYMARYLHGVSLSFWDNGSGIDRRCPDLSWKVARVGDMLVSTVRSSYSTGLDTIYLSEQVSGDIQIPLTLNGNTFTAIDGLTEGEDYTYANGTVTLKADYINGKFTGDYGIIDTIVMQFSAGLDWHMFLVYNSAAESLAASGTRGGITIGVNYNGNHIHRVSAFRNEAPSVLTGLMDGQGTRVGGNHTSWWPYLEYGGAYLVHYERGTFALRSGFFSDTVQDGVNVVVLEFYDGSRLDIILDVSGNTVTARAADAVVPQITTTPGEITTAPDEITTAPDEITTAPDEITTAPDEITTAPDEITTAPDEITTAPDEITTAQTTTPQPEPEFSFYDMNQDGVVDINDALEVLKSLARLPSTVEVEVTIDVALEILKYLAGLPSMVEVRD
jgi:endoglucanase